MDIFMLTHTLEYVCLKGGNADYGNLAYVDFGMMDTITNSDRLTLIKAIVHIIMMNISSAKDFQKLGFLTKTRSSETC